MNKITTICGVALASALLVGCGTPKNNSSSSESSSSESSSSVSSSSESSSSSSVAVIPFELSSPSLNSGSPLDAQYSCEGKDFLDGGDVIPALSWTAGPEGTQSYAIAFKDMTIVQGGGPNVANGYHWAMWNIPASTTSTPEAMAGGSGGVSGASQMSPYQDNKYMGPCPNYNFCSTGQRENHEYAFVVYALAEGSVNPGNSVQSIDGWLENNALEKTEIWVTSDAAASAQCGGGGGNPGIDGAQLFADRCSACHTGNGMGSGSFGGDVTGESASEIQQAINNVGVMGSLSDLSADEIQAIADAL